MNINRQLLESASLNPQKIVGKTIFLPCVQTLRKMNLLSLFTKET